MGKHARRWLNFLAISFGGGLFLGLTREIEPLQRLDGLTREYQASLLPIAIAIAAVGWLIFMASIIYMLIISSRRNPRLRGQIQTSFTFSEIKSALRRGTFWREHRYRLLFIIATGALTMCLGILSIAFIMGEPGIKLLVGFAAVYAIIRTGWGFAQA